MSTLVAVTAVTRPIDVDMREPVAYATAQRRFSELIAKAGATPVSVAPDADPGALLERVDAVVINGGQDVEPGRYGAAPHPKLGPVDAERDDFELALVRGARERGVPVLGVCRGMHVVNVAAGGTLVQHLADVTDLDHHQRRRFDEPVHDVAVEPGSALAGILGTGRLAVNSVHHQGVERLGEGLAAAARADDGTVEAVEGDGGLTLGIQWHPEFLPSDQDDAHLPLFGHLVSVSGSPGS